MSDLPDLLAQLAERLDVREVVLRCEHSILERVYVSVKDGHLVAHDDCETSRWLMEHGGIDGRPWSEPTARAACERFGVELTQRWQDVPEDEVEWNGFRIQRRVEAGDEDADIVGAVAKAIDAVHLAHAPPDSW